MPETPQIPVGSRSLSVEGTQFNLLSPAGAIERSWKRVLIRELRTSRVGGLLPKWSLDVRIGDDYERVVVLRSQGSILAAVEDAASALGVRFEEHTGRSVEADEHGLNISEQLQRFPQRWGRPPHTESMEVEFETQGTGFKFTLPSTIPPTVLALFLSSISLCVILGASSFLFLALDSRIITALFLLLVLSGWYITNLWTNMLEHRHSIQIDHEHVEVQGYLMHFIPAPPIRYAIDDFRDLDVTSKGRLAFLFSDRRVFCDIPRREGEWVVGEVGHRIRSMISRTEDLLKDESE